MSIVFVLVPLAVGLLGVALAAFFWAVAHGQFDDLDSPGVRMLLDDQEPVAPSCGANAGADHASGSRSR